MNGEDRLLVFRLEQYTQYFISVYNKHFVIAFFTTSLHNASQLELLCAWI